LDRFASKDEKKIGKYIVGIADPVKGKVSHAFIYKTWMVPGAQANTFTYINDSKLDSIIGGGSGNSSSGNLSRSYGSFSSGGKGGSSLGEQPQQSDSGAAPAGPLGPAWSPLNAATSGAASGGSPRPGGGGPSVGGGGPLAGGGSVAPPSVPPATTGGAAMGPGKDGGKAERRRYEFVVMVIWREPVPSIAPDAETTDTSK
jgi:hypothetical protein